MNVSPWTLKVRRFFRLVFTCIYRHVPFYSQNCYTDVATLLYFVLTCYGSCLIIFVEPLTAVIRNLIAPTISHVNYYSAGAVVRILKKRKSVFGKGKGIIKTSSLCWEASAGTAELIWSKKMHVVLIKEAIDRLNFCNQTSRTNSFITRACNDEVFIEYQKTNALKVGRSSSLSSKSFKSCKRKLLQFTHCLLIQRHIFLIS